MFQRILVAIDPTDARRAATSTAGQLAQLTGARVHVVHVAASTVAAGTVLVLEDEIEGEAILKESLAVLHDLGVEADGHVAQGFAQEVAAIISTEAEDFQADLLVVSPHHRSSVAAFFNPRVSDAIAHAGRIAVLLVPEDSAER